jgi:hypothetical protein
MLEVLHHLFCIPHFLENLYSFNILARLIFKTSFNRQTQYILKTNIFPSAHSVLYFLRFSAEFLYLTHILIPSNHPKGAKWLPI